MKKWFIPLLCSLPIMGVLLWLIVGKSVANLATIGLLLACPLSHVFLMKHNGKGGDNHGKK